MTSRQSLKKFNSICKENRIKITHQRTQIYATVISLPGHPSVEEIFEKVRQKIPMISLDTVYRTITTFERYGIVKRMQLLDDKARFEANLDLHHHLICSKCKKIEDFSWGAFDKLNIPDTVGNWGEISSKHVELRGICRECIAK